MSREWFVRKGGKVQGPIDGTTLSRLAKTGKVTPTTEVSRQRDGPWVKASRVKGLFPASPSTSARTEQPPLFVVPPVIWEEVAAEEATPTSAPGRLPGGYVESNLLRGESVVYWAELSWFVFVAPLVFMGLAFITLFALIDGGSRNAMAGGLLLGGFIGLVGMSLLIDRYITYISSEFAVTTKRVIMKSGFIRRHTLELLHNQINALSVDQGILGRIFDFGTVGVAVAGDKQTFPFVSNPLEFRKQVQARQAS